MGETFFGKLHTNFQQVVPLVIYVPQDTKQTCLHVSDEVSKFYDMTATLLREAKRSKKVLQLIGSTINSLLV